MPPNRLERSKDAPTDRLMPDRSKMPRPGPHCEIPPPTPDSDFQTALQAAFDEGRVLNLNAPLTLEAPVAIRVTVSHQRWHGLVGGMNNITSKVKGAPTIRIYMDDQSPVGVCTRAMVLKDFSLVGGEGSGLVMDVPFNDRWVVNPLLQNLWFENVGGFAGLEMKGSIFEGNLYSVGSMDCANHGAYFANSGSPDNFGIVSALRYFGGTHRQNGDCGIVMDQYNGPSDVRLNGLYFCSNKGLGIYNKCGLQSVVDCGFENNGEYGIYFENWANLHNCSGSTFGVQKWLVKGYVINRSSMDHCSMMSYGGTDPGLAQLSGNGVMTLLDSEGRIENTGVDLQRVNTQAAASAQSSKRR